MSKFVAAASGFCLSLSIASIASAADLRTPLSAPVIPAFSWTGFYAGVNAGYAFGAGRTLTIGTPGFQTLPPLGIAPDRLKSSPSGFLGGVTAGFNRQSGFFVYGVEADIAFANQRKSETFIGGPVLGTRLATTASQRLDNLGTLRARFGAVATQRLLVYATGGLAFGTVRASGSVVGVDAPALVWEGRSSRTRVGWTLGGGMEYALTDNLTLKGEYLYYDLGRQTVSAIGNAAVRAVPALDGIDYVGRSEIKGSVLRAGLNARF